MFEGIKKILFFFSNYNFNNFTRRNRFLLHWEIVRGSFLSGGASIQLHALIKLSRDLFVFCFLLLYILSVHCYGSDQRDTHEISKFWKWHASRRRRVDEKKIIHFLREKRQEIKRQNTHNNSISYFYLQLQLSLLSLFHL